MYSQDFINEAKRMEENGTLNMYVAEAIANRVPAADLEKEIKLAIKMHTKYSKQPGSSALHVGVVAGCWTLLGLLRKVAA